MTEREAIASLKTLCNTCTMFPICVNNKPECFQAIETAISALEKQEQDRWIPCKERLPEYKEKVLVSYDTEDGKKVDISMFDRYGCLLGIVDAWRPLPEQYTEEEA